MRLSIVLALMLALLGTMWAYRAPQIIKEMETMETKSLSRVAITPGLLDIVVPGMTESEVAEVMGAGPLRRSEAVGTMTTTTHVAAVWKNRQGRFFECRFRNGKLESTSADYMRYEQ